MITKKEKKPKNKYLEYYKRYVRKLKKGLLKLGFIEDETNEKIKNFASYTLKLFDDKKPDKDKKMKEQANEQQLELINYLEGLIY